MSGHLSNILIEESKRRELILRQGKVVSIQTGPPRTATVLIGGTNYVGIRIADHVDPAIDEGVWIDDMGSGRWLITSTNGNTQTRPQYVRAAGDTMTGDLTMSGSQVVLDTATSLSDLALQFGSDPNTGIRRAASDTIDLVAGGTAGASMTASLLTLNVPLTVASNGVVTAGKLKTTDQPYFELRHNASVSAAASTFVGVPWATETSDAWGMHGSAATYITVPVAGVWLFWATVMTDNSTTAGNRSFAFYKNNDTASDTTASRYGSVSIDKNTATQWNLNISAIIPMAANDTLYPYIWHNVSGGPFNWCTVQPAGTSRKDLNAFGGALLFAT
jgi:hypothetical protein